MQIPDLDGRGKSIRARTEKGTPFVVEHSEEVEKEPGNETYYEVARSKEPERVRDLRKAFRRMAVEDTSR